MNHSLILNATITQTEPQDFNADEFEKNIRSALKIIEINTYLLRLSARFLDVPSHRKEVALFLKNQNTEHFGIIIQRFFLEVDDDQVSQYIWKKVEQKRKEHAKINGRLVPQTFFNKVGQDA